MCVKAAYVLCLKKMPSIVDKLSVKKICVDDFAIRKRFSYGTVMVDLETHRIIDLIPSRDVADVKAWLSKFPNVEVVSRDGAQIYASAAIGAHPGAMQVSDRFHLIKGLSEAIDKYIIRTYPARLEIPAVLEITEEMKLLLNINNRSKRIRFAHDKKQQGMTVNEIALTLHASPKTIEKYLNIDPNSVEDRVILREGQHRLALEQKQHDVNEARRLYSEGMAIEVIAKELHHAYKTIQNYLNPEYSIVNGHYNVRIPNKLAPYEEEVKTLRSQGMTYPRIHKIICEKGYDGSEASIRMFMQKERIRQAERAANPDVNSDYQPKEYVQRKALSQLIYKSIEDVYIINKEQLQMVLKTYPLLADLYAMIKEFYEIIYSKKAARLDDWISRMEMFHIPEIQTYINGVRKDINAVKNGISLAYNNGLAEGSVNKIKVIKRIMYGRNSFDLLKAKVLFHEEFCCKIN
jgi:transposase